MKYPYIIFIYISLHLFTASALAQTPETLGKEGPRTYQLGAKIGFIEKIGIVRQRPIAYILKRGQLELAFDHHFITESFDFLNVKKEFKEDSELDFIDFSGNVGDLRGNHFSLQFGLLDDLMLLNQYSSTNLEYGTGTVTIDRLAVGGRYELSKEDSGPQWAVELKLQQTRGSGFEKNFTQIEIQGSTGTTTQKYDKVQTAKFGGLNTDDGELKFLLSSQISDHWYAHGYIGHQRSHTSSEIDFALPGFEPFKELVDRDEQFIRIGAGLDWEFREQWLADLFLEGSRISRAPKIKNAPDENRALTLGLYYSFLQNWTVNLNTKYFDQFFTGEYPFLLNERTFSVFDKPYGYIGIGISYKENYSTRTSYPYFIQSPSP